ncbi:hypothetical protein M0R72_09295 [Candidatus Pacearchaeota archaeon]|jgi:hypothetical protein|nr:hypothetical protein [Candidatus Pacearchaeota archaeon]
MATKDITDEMVCRAVAQCQKEQTGYDAGVLVSTCLIKQTGESTKVVWSAMNRAYHHGLIDYGVSIFLPWLTESGKQLIAKPSVIPQEHN